MIDSPVIVKINKLIANIKNNYPKLKMSLNVDLINGFTTLYIKYGKNKLFTTFANTGSCLLCLNFLYTAKFSSKALKSIKKKIHKRKKNLFFLWLENGCLWKEAEHKTLGELWEEFEQEIAPQEEEEQERREDPAEDQGTAPTE